MLFLPLLLFGLIFAEDQSFCYDDCSDNGKCVDYMCICNAGWYGEKCSLQFSPEPALSVGIQLTKEIDLTKLCKNSRKQQIIVLGVSSKSCAKCDELEPEYVKLSNLLHNFNSQISDDTFIFRRIDSANRDFSGLLREVEASFVPCLIICTNKCKQKRIFRAESKAETVMAHLRKLIFRPYTTLTSFTDLKDDLQIWKPFVNTFSIAFFLAADQIVAETKHEDEFVNFKKASTEVYVTEHIKPYLAVDELTKNMVDMFPVYSSVPTIVVVRFDLETYHNLTMQYKNDLKQIFSLFSINKEYKNSGSFFIPGGELSYKTIGVNDFNGESMEIRNFIVSRSVPVGDYLVPHLFRYFELHPRPMFMFYFRKNYHETHNPKKLKKVLKSIRQVAREAIDSFYFVLCDYNRLMEQGKEMYVYLKENEFGLTVNLANKKMYVPIVSSKFSKFTQEKIRKFAKAVKSQTLPEMTDSQKHNLRRIGMEKEEKIVKKSRTIETEVVEDEGVSEKFNASEDRIVSITRGNFKDLLLEEETSDICVFLYNSQEVESLKLIPHFKKVVKRFRDIVVPHLYFYHWDRRERWLPPEFLGLTEIKAPGMVLLPAFSRPEGVNFVFTSYTAEFRTLPVMKWIQANAHTNFTLPNLPQFDQIEKKAYKDQIKKREERRKDEL